MLFILYNIEGKSNRSASFVMTKLMTTLTISAIASVLIIGGFATATPNAFSTYGGGHHNNDDDDCDNWNYGYYHNEDDDDCDNNPPKDPCDCEKPDTLKFKFSTPSGEINSEFRIEIYKKLNDIGNSDKKLMSIADVTNSLEDYQIEASSFGKDKLNSNTVFAIYKIVEDQEDVLVSEIEIHTSCSKPLYKGMTVMDNGYSLEVSDGLKNGKSSISESNPITCGDEPEPKQMGRIVIRNALTVDNGGNAAFTDFTYKITDVDSGNPFDLIQDENDPSLNEVEAPKGTYTLSQIITPEITESYTQVLITGDKKCPSTLNEPISIKKGKTISCTIYNDDNGDGGSGEGGIIFRNFSMQVQLGNNTAANSCDAIPNAIDKNACIEIVDPSAGRIAIVDSALTSDTTIVLFSITEANKFQTAEGALTLDCTVEGIVKHDKEAKLLQDGTIDEEEPGVYPTNPSSNNVVVAKCGTMMANEVYNVNYIMIDPLF